MRMARARARRRGPPMTSAPRRPLQILVSRGGAVEVRTLRRRALTSGLQPKAQGPPPEQVRRPRRHPATRGHPRATHLAAVRQDVPIPVPKKTQLYLDSTLRERQCAVAMHRKFQVQRRAQLGSPLPFTPRARSGRPHAAAAADGQSLRGSARAGRQRVVIRAGRDAGPAGFGGSPPLRSGRVPRQQPHRAWPHAGPGSGPNARTRVRTEQQRRRSPRGPRHVCRWHRGLVDRAPAHAPGAHCAAGEGLHVSGDGAPLSTTMPPPPTHLVIPGMYRVVLGQCAVRGAGCARGAPCLRNRSWKVGAAVMQGRVSAATHFPPTSAPRLPPRTSCVPVLSAMIALPAYDGWAEQ